MRDVSWPGGLAQLQHMSGSRSGPCLLGTVARWCRSVRASWCMPADDPGKRDESQGLVAADLDIATAHTVRILDGVGEGTVVAKRNAWPPWETLPRWRRRRDGQVPEGSRLEVVIEPTKPTWLPIAVFFRRDLRRGRRRRYPRRATREPRGSGSHRWPARPAALRVSPLAGNRLGHNWRSREEQRRRNHCAVTRSRTGEAAARVQRLRRTARRMRPDIYT
jgi:hypothetical protein